MKLAIVGSRDFNDYELLKKTLEPIKKNVTLVVSGGAKGADSLGERYAKENNIKCEQFPAEWDKYGKSAGYRRNKQMADIANALIVFWDGESRGTKHMIDIAKEKDLKSIVVKY